MFQIMTHALELERQGKNIIHFELGDPDFQTPRHIVEAGIKALEAGRTHYAPPGGIYELKKAAAEVTLHSRGFMPSLSQLLVCPGANIMIYYAAACVLEPGDEVIVPDPCFVSYISILKFIDISIKRVQLHEENEFRLLPSHVECAITPKTKMIILNSPSNPTGAVSSAEDIREVYKIAKRNNLFLLSDEIYARMIYDSDAEHFSPSIFDHCEERTILVNGFSKSYAMTGWRLGVLTAPEFLIAKMTLLQETLLSCVPPFVQYAGISALTSSQEKIFEMVDEYRQRRNLLVNGLNSLPGIRCVKPKGAFYAFPNIKGTGMSSEEFSTIMIDKAGVAVAPGNIFGPSGEGYVRLCYVNSLENIEKAIGRMRNVLI